MRHDKTNIKNDDQLALRDEFPEQARRYVKDHDEIVDCGIGYHANFDGDNKIKRTGQLD